MSPEIIQVLGYVLLFAVAVGLGVWMFRGDENGE